MSRPRDRLRVALLWPGGLLERRGFGVPHLLLLAAALRRATDAEVSVVDLALERRLGAGELRAVVRAHDLFAVSCYSSYDYLLVVELMARLRALAPGVPVVVGGYHPSACPEDFLSPPLPSPLFDWIVDGEGEGPLVALVGALARGSPPPRGVLPRSTTPAPFPEAPAYDWRLLERYRAVAREGPRQAEIYLSRGCPHACAFCMERAKRMVCWRALPAEAACEELHALDAFLDLSGWSVKLCDPMFGHDASWRRELLERLARRPTRALRLWLLTRLDYLEREDLELMARARVSPGFGFESAAPEQLRRMRKTAQPTAYVDRLRQIAREATRLELPFGVNVIVGHPGETAQTLRETARVLEEVFLSPDRTHGFISVDPFRLYPGSSIALERRAWETETGFVAHRYPWWHDGDPGFLSEWVSPSTELDYARTRELQERHFDPILRRVRDHFAYRGDARGYFVASLDEQLAFIEPGRRLRDLGLQRLWCELLREPPPAGAAEPGGVGPRAAPTPAHLARTARAARATTLARLRVELSPALREALLRVPREEFVRLEDIAHSASDVALWLNDDRSSTISSLHAYASSLGALALRPGDTLVELGAGTGYGAALASELVGPEGRVLAIESTADLAARASRLLAHYPQTTVVAADAFDTARWRGATKVLASFAVRALPETFLDALGEGGLLVIPLGDEAQQRLTRVTRLATGIELEPGPCVRYVMGRAPAASPPLDP